MFLDKEYFDGWMQRLSERLERIEKLCAGDVEQPLSILPDGERLLDNYDLCRMLNISKRTLQRYRTSGELPYEMIYHKTFYRESDVLRFIEPCRIWQGCHQHPFQAARGGVRKRVHGHQPAVHEAVLPVLPEISHAV